MGLECDFVGLRSETYTDSRIPDQVQLGTPEEDALRRDLTINSLFYNVHTREVEDYTKKGLEDLENKVARTPLPPKQTFEDDPLRVLRCVRFASRFDLSVAEEVTEAIKMPEIQVCRPVRYKDEANFIVIPSQQGIKGTSRDRSSQDDETSSTPSHLPYRLIRPTRFDIHIGIRSSSPRLDKMCRNSITPVRLV